MTWQQIGAGETDANSPLNQTLMDKIRNNLDYLRAAGAQMMFINGTFSNNLTAADFTLDSSMDWRDRFLQVVGNVIIFASITNFIPGGADDDELGSEYDTINGAAIVGQFNQWMYTSDGGANKTADPHLYTDWYGAAEKAYVWVDAAAGNLKLSIATGRGAGYRDVAVNLRIVYSEDQGGH